MTLLVIIALLATLLFGSLTLFFSIREERIKELLSRQINREKKRLYEITILKSIQDKIGYSLNIEQVVDTLTGSLKDLFSYSVASSLVFVNNKLIFKSYSEEPLNETIFAQIKKIMVESLQSYVTIPLPQETQDILLGIANTTSTREPLKSSFTIPFVINGETLGLIYVASTRANFYRSEDITIFSDIAKQASMALSKLEEVITTENEKLLSMITSLAEGIFMIDLNNTITIINDNAKKLLCLQTTPRTVNDLAGIFPSQFSLSQKIECVLKDKKVQEEKELSIGDKILRVVITPVMNHTREDASSKEHVIGVSVLLHDITLEKKLAKLKEDFTSEVVHELRSPLTAIESGSDLMINQKDQLDKNQEQKLLEIINKQSKRMLGDINSLLDAAKLESGHFAIYQKPESIETLLNDTVSLFASEAKKKNITLSLTLEPNLPKGLFDQIRITQVLDNLISNSLKYTPDNGKIIISAKNFHNQQLPQSTTNPGIIITVADTGIGIAPDKQANLFSKFARIENVAYVHSKEGTGLGLYITKGIVEAHGGKIFLESYPERGTTVSFTLPIAHTIENYQSNQILTPLSLSKAAN